MENWLSLLNPGAIIKMNITIKDSTCFICGKDIHPGDRIRAHLIPKSLKPETNVFTYFHKECEDRLNSLYGSHQKKSEVKRAKKKMLNMINDCHTKLRTMEERIEEESE